ncbi:MAG: hypothetical protein L0Z62_01325 [Gemmataceae bacterium]|nr:hypothetical protein [Gemmataceae bacterium]
MLAWQQLVHQSDDELSRLDIAEVNLACAAGLPDAEGIDPELCQFRLDYWARQVRQETDFTLPRFRRKRYDYRNSEGYFRILVMVTVLQRDCGVRYNPTKTDADAPFTTEDIFVHGITQGWGGTCASLPVVYIAVGRRLGYPLKLVLARTKNCGHLFVRWDDPARERFNIEATSLGLHSDPDDYYRSGVYQVSAAEERACCLLQSLTPRQELAAFLAERGHRWGDFKRYRRAVEGFAWASALHPQNQAYQNTLHQYLDDWTAALGRLRPPRFPRFSIAWPPRRYPDTLPEVLEKGIIGLEVAENLLNDQEHERNWWGPLRRGECVANAPEVALVECHTAGMRVRFEFSGQG